ncbi:hypothetical protein EJ08DRAFT_692776 [Tothia fuscella]|uniref:Uncharacterized protein n=1 Tax=Tothia fuscella TaxID=1048955 RepID=A0A9P4U3Z2_9PEZI|nr:hypothetical protein EJ08DRAFT_692776 [Tothia fuscella]
MLSLLCLFYTLLAVASAQTHYLYGPMWGYRRYGSGAGGFITSLETTLVAGKPTSPPKALIALWPGMDTAKGLIQPIIVSSDRNGQLYPGCRAIKADEWCIFASMIVGNTQQKSGKAVPWNGLEPLKMTFKWDEALGGYDQKLFLKGQEVSSLKYASGKSVSFYVATECQGSHTGIVNNHTYSDNTVVLSQPNPVWGKTPSTHYMACADRAETADGGTTWKIPHIKLQQSNAPKDYNRGAGTSPGPTFCP